MSLKKPLPVKVGEWLPDFPMLTNPGSPHVKNALPEVDSYTQWPSLSEFSNALDAPVNGAIWLQDSNNTFFNFAGTYNETSGASKLYSLDGNLNWSDVSKGAGYTSFVDWEFAKFGDRVIATNNNDAVQYLDLGGSNFADLPGSPSRAQRIAVVRDFIVMGDSVDLGPADIFWSGFNNSEQWVPSQLTQSDRQTLFGRGGRVQRIIPGQYGVIFREHSIHRMDYVGPPIIFQLDEVEPGRGTPSPNSVVWDGVRNFYFGWDGFYNFNGVQSESISENRVERWFENSIDGGTLDKIRGVIDRRNKLVMWAFRTSSSLAYNNRILAFNWGANRWSYGEVDTEHLAEFITSGFNLDTLDTPLPNGVDIDSIRMESTAYLGGALGLQAFTPNHKSADFSGAALIAEIDTKEELAGGGSMTYMNAARPLVEGSPATDIQLAYLTRNKQTDNAVETPLRSLNEIGEANIRKTARFVRGRLKISGGFDHATGIEILARRTAGRR